MTFLFFILPLVLGAYLSHDCALARPLEKDIFNKDFFRLFGQNPKDDLMSTRRISERAVSLKQLLGVNLQRDATTDEYLFIVSATSDRAFLDSWFGKNVSQHLAVRHPELSRLWDAPNADVVANILRGNPHFFHNALIDLYKIAPDKYGLLFNFGNPELSVGEFRRHIRSLVESQLDRDALKIVAISKTRSSSVLDENVQTFLDDLPTSDEQRRAAALPIIHQWVIEGSALTGTARVADVNMARAYYLRDLPLASASTIAGAASALAWERVTGPDAIWAGTRQRCVYRRNDGPANNCICMTELLGDEEKPFFTIANSDECGVSTQVRTDGRKPVDVIFIPLHALPHSSGTDWYCESGYKSKYDVSSNRVGCEAQ